MQTMVERDAQYKLCGNVQVDDAYLGGELAGGKAGRGSENKVPFVAAISLNAKGRPMYIKMAPISGFTRKAIAIWANEDLTSGCVVTSDGLGCFAGVIDAGCQHKVIIAGGRKPKDLPEFNWINTVLGNLKTSLGGAYHAFDFAKYGARYLGAFVYRFNRRFHLETLPLHLVVAAISILISKMLQLNQIFSIIRCILTQTNLAKRDCHGYEPYPIPTRLIFACIPCAVWH